MSNFINTINIQARAIEQQEKELETTKGQLEECLLILKSIKDDDGSRYNRPSYYPIAINFLNKLKNKRGGEDG